MRRKLSNLAAAVSLVLCVAAAVLWVRSYWVAESLHHTWKDIRWESPGPLTLTRMQVVMSGRGTVAYTVIRTEARALIATYPGVGWAYRRWRSVTSVGLTPTEDDELNVSLFGFQLLHRIQRPGGTHRISEFRVVVPYWFVCLTFAAVPAARVARRGRRTATACPACGYDLRATPDRCPECGAVPEPPHNPPMQRTGGSGYVCWSAKVGRGGPGR